jgi:poly-beta-1,6-N-acetyl-D-glucosamine synthase
MRLKRRENKGIPMNEKPNYVIISPVRDEEKHIQQTMDSVIGQSLRPLEWIIVDDGSTDGTGKILEEYCGRHDWIKVVRRKNKGNRRAGGRVIQVFNDGYNVITDGSWDFIVKLDCDLSFKPDFFEMLLGEFMRDEQLGIASGVYFEADRSGRWLEVEMPSYHAAGACKVVRRKCFEDISRFVVADGWDTVDEIKAMARGWKTRHFRHLQAKHHKIEGSGVGMIRTSLMHGRIYFLTGGSNLFFLFKFFDRVSSKPYVLSAFAMLWGYFRAALTEEGRLVTSREASCYQGLLHKRLLMRARKLILKGASPSLY